MRLIAQPELRQSIPSARSVLAPLTHTPLSELPSVDDSVSETSLSARTLHSLHSNTTLGIIFSVDVKRVDAQLLLEAVAQVCAPTMALLLQQQWLRRDRFKRLLQLELHRTVFQVGMARNWHFRRIRATFPQCASAEIFTDVTTMSFLYSELFMENLQLLWLINCAVRSRQILLRSGT